MPVELYENVLFTLVGLWSLYFLEPKYLDVAGDEPRDEDVYNLLRLSNGL